MKDKLTEPSSAIVCQSRSSHLSRVFSSAGEDELVPSDILDSLLVNVNAVKVWREYRGMSQAALADAAGMSQAYIAQIETGKREGRIQAYRAIASVLEVNIDDLV